MEKPGLRCIRPIIVTMALTLMLLGAHVPISKAQKAKAAECRVEITSPKPGSGVTSPEEVEGKANIPDNGFLWILAHRRGLGVWWPQEKAEINSSTGSWKVTVTYGEDRDRAGTEFEIVAVVVSEQDSKKLEEWIRKAQETGNYRNPPRRPPDIGGCQLATPILVVKQ